MTERKGPLESRAWPEALEASVTDESEGHHRLLGYDVETDLAVHYRFSDGVYLALVGELPDAARSRAFELALMFLLPLPVAQGPTHAAVLAGFVGSPPSGVIATAAVTLAQDAVRTLELLVLAEEGEGELSPELGPSSEHERSAVERLRRMLEGVLDVPLLARRPNRELALFAVLRRCGLTSPLQIASAITLARLSAVVAEAAPRASQSFVEHYPLATPPMVYVP